MATSQSLTWFLCPILWARAWACKSFWGFQSESKMMTVSAVARLIPRPPARVDNRKQKSFKEITKPAVSAVKDWSSLCDSLYFVYHTFFFLDSVQQWIPFPAIRGSFSCVCWQEKREVSSSGSSYQDATKLKVWQIGIPQTVHTPVKLKTSRYNILYMLNSEKSRQVKFYWFL